MQNALLIRWSGGWHEVTDAASIAANGRREALLGIGAVQSLEEVARVAARQLDIFADPRTEIAADLVPVHNTDMPYIAFGVSDTVLVPDADGTPAREQIMALTVAEDDNGQLSYAPELKDVILSDRERWEQSLKKMVDGTLGGQSSVATPAAYVTAAPSGGAGGMITGFEAAFSLPGALTAQYSPPITTPVNCRFDAVVVTVRTVAATFRVRVLRDDVEVFNQVIAADAELTVAAGDQSTSDADSTLWIVHVSECSVSTGDVNVAVRFA